MNYDARMCEYSPDISSRKLPHMNSYLIAHTSAFSLLYECCDSNLAYVLPFLRSFIIDFELSVVGMLQSIPV